MHHPRLGHGHPSVGTVLDAVLAVALAVIALWAVFVLMLLLHGALKAGA